MPRLPGTRNVPPPGCPGVIDGDYLGGQAAIAFWEELEFDVCRACGAPRCRECGSHTVVGQLPDGFGHGFVSHGCEWGVSAPEVGEL